VRKSPEQRFWNYVEMIPFHGCWEWSGSRRNGYGQFYVDGRVVYAHRFAHELLVGPIPTERWVLHHCDNPGCVNPAHLFLGDAAANVRDMLAKGRQGIHHNTVKTHCKRGHPFDEANTVLRSTGGRRCRICWYTQEKTRVRAPRHFSLVPMHSA
jgi:hypothetical protein